MNAVKTPGATGLLITGVVLMILGIAAIVSPAVAGVWVVYLVGALLVIGGLLHVWQGVRSEGATRKLSMMVMGVIVTIAGLAILLNAEISLTVLTLILAVFFVVEGVGKMFTSLSYRPARGWPAVLLSGFISLALGGMIWYQWPFSGLWAVGILVGVDLLVSGAALVALAVTVRQLKQKLKQAAAA